ncbi:MAG: 5-(carboxyamino)imidazole ribonucleotide mutase [Leptospiraceae bacterium]|nr:5-(carboxyamino)imidazole ribonucleotide mutase [Leptospiraceae bacterium]MDW7976900.1 5-(carboxyamino)imidazole ribonucleotide mutase [Leptospiraceae bacterium]
MKELPRHPIVGVIMGSVSDLETMKEAVEILSNFQIPHEVKIVSAHRTPEWMFEYAKTAEERGIEVIIAAAGGAAHLPGMTASITTLPVIGVPILSKSLNGLDSLLSIVQMPAGIPVATVAIGNAGAKNSALLAIRILSIKYKELSQKLKEYYQQLKESVLSENEKLQA